MLILHVFAYQIFMLSLSRGWIRGPSKMGFCPLGLCSANHTVSLFFRKTSKASCKKTWIFSWKAIKALVIHYTIQQCHFLILRYSFQHMQFKRVKTMVEELMYLYPSRNCWQLLILHNLLNSIMDVERPLMLIYSLYSGDLNYSISVFEHASYSW